MPYLAGLPNTTENQDCEIVSTVTAAFNVLRQGTAASASGDNGAINLWYDDDGDLRGERMRFLITEDSQTFSTKKEARTWLKDALQKIQ
jgi:uncharacterized protein YllA (UPF0747 family)